MKLLYFGQQLGDINCARFTWSKAAMLAADGSTYGYQYEANFSEISFACFGQADCKTKMDFVEALLEIPYGDLLVLNDDLTNSTNCVASLNTLSGVKPGRLVWGDQPGAQFTTWRQFSISFTWETRASGLAATFLTEFSETVRVQGGTPLTRVQEPINVAVSSYDEFIVLPKQKFVVTQQGRAVGLFQYPAAGSPLYPNPNTNSVATTTPSRLGGPVTAYEKWPIEWSYSWEFGDLPSLPIANLWP